jgi:hypothetical protein
MLHPLPLQLPSGDSGTGTIGSGTTASAILTSSGSGTTASGTGTSSGSGTTITALLHPSTLILGLSAALLLGMLWDWCLFTSSPVDVPRRYKGMDFMFGNHISLMDVGMSFTQLITIGNVQHIVSDISTLFLRSPPTEHSINYHGDYYYYCLKRYVSLEVLLV